MSIVMVYWVGFVVNWIAFPMVAAIIDDNRVDFMMVIFGCGWAMLWPLADAAVIVYFLCKLMLWVKNWLEWRWRG